MQGLITERHFVVAERCFPGIRRLYRELLRKPATFLELVWEYERGVGAATCLTTPSCGFRGRRRAR